MTMCESEIIISSPPTIGDTLSRLISNNHEMKNNNNGQEEGMAAGGDAERLQTSPSEAQGCTPETYQ